jgi:hypothetical protein
MKCRRDEKRRLPRGWIRGENVARGTGEGKKKNQNTAIVGAAADEQQVKTTTAARRRRLTVGAKTIQRESGVYTPGVGKSAQGIAPIKCTENKMKHDKTLWTRK